LTRSKLVTTIISATNLTEKHSFRSFCEGVVIQISSLINTVASGVFCAKAGSVIGKDDDGVYVLGAVGEFAHYIHERLENLHDVQIVKLVANCLQFKKHIFEEEFFVNPQTLNEMFVLPFKGG
jgi:hypothetical protein